jgi:transcriptional regulator GlxA family with amidase domain
MPEIRPESLTVGILLFDGVEELDFVGPWEVFTMAAACGLAVETCTIAATEVVRCAKGLRVLADHTVEAAPKLDILVVPGGRGTRRDRRSPDLVAWIAQKGPDCAWVTSVCTGALLLAEAGLTREKRVTTHWNALDLLESYGAAGTVVRGERVVVDGRLVTAAGVSAGIDMALRLVGTIWGAEAARKVQKQMEYYPEPPYPEAA